MRRLFNRQTARTALRHRHIHTNTRQAHLHNATGNDHNVFTSGEGGREQPLPASFQKHFHCECLFSVWRLAAGDIIKMFCFRVSRAFVWLVDYVVPRLTVCGRCLTTIRSRQQTRTKKNVSKVQRRNAEVHTQMRCRRRNVSRLRCWLLFGLMANYDRVQWGTKIREKRLSSAVLFI